MKLGKLSTLFVKIIVSLLFASVVFWQSCDDNDVETPAIGPFKVVGTQLQDPCGGTVLLKGVNKMSVYDGEDPYGVNYFPEIAKTNANCVRIVWRAKVKGVPTVLSQLDSLIKNCIKNKMIPMIELHDATCDWSLLDDVVNYWIRPDVVALIQKYQHALLVNIANEAGRPDLVTDAQFLTGYKSAITQMRNAGIHTPLIIDGKDCGKHLDVLVSEGPALMAHDPDHNIMFSVHTYWSKIAILGVQPTFIKDQLKKAKDANIPLILGELCAYGGWPGEENLPAICPQQAICQELGSIDYKTLLSEAAANNFGYLAWEWGPGNLIDDCDPVVLCPAMDITTDGTYQSIVNIPVGSVPRGWVRDVVIDSPFSIKNTSVKSSYILNGFTCQ